VIQRGFIKKRSCLTNLLEFLEMFCNCIDQDLPINAFDKLLYKKLMLKAKAFGIAGLVFNWIQDWLQD
jgi:hypothetical protein